jgi:hypothetical protein
MANALTNAQTTAYQFEKVRPNISLMFQRDDTLLGKIKKSTDVEIVSSRNMRQPARLLAGGIGSQFSPAGADMGRGSGTTTDVFQLTPVFFSFAVEINKDVEAYTNTKAKAIEDVGKTELQSALDQFNVLLEALLNTSGAGDLGLATAAPVGNVLSVDNANQFADDQPVLFQNGLGTAPLGAQSYQILSVDPLNKQLVFKTALPGGIINGTIILINGSPGITGSSLFGVEYLNLQANTGTFLQLSRAAYPGKITTPHVAFGGQPLTPQSARLGLQLVRRAMGAKALEEAGLEFQFDLAGEASWENVGLVVTQVIQNQLTGSSSEDMLKKSAPKSFCGYPMFVSIHAKPGRIDGIPLKHWGRAECQAIDFMDWGGQTMLPVVGASGGYSAATLFYLWTGFQIFSDNPRLSLYMDGISLPSGY